METITIAELSVLKENILPLLTVSEKEALNKGLGLLDLEFEDFFMQLTGIIISENTTIMIDVLNMPNLSIVQKIEVDYENYSLEEREILRDFLKVLSVMFYIICEKAANNGYSIEIAKYIDRIIFMTNKIGERFPDDEGNFNGYIQKLKEHKKSILLAHSLNSQIINKLFANIFHWQVEEKLITELFTLLAIHYKLIENDFDKFKSLFSISGKKLFDYDGRIKWIAEDFNTVQLAYLFHELCDRGFINRIQKHKINSILQGRFCDVNGDSACFKNLRRIYSRFKTSQRNGNRKSQAIEDIDELLSKLHL